MSSRIAVWVGLALCAAGVRAQNTRYDYIATTTAGSGQAVPLLAIPGASVTFYNFPAMTLASTYNSATSVTPCPTSPSAAQVVLQQTAVCVATADFQGNFGAWFAAGQYAWTLKVNGGSYGPYNFTIGGGSGGSGTVTSVTFTGDGVLDSATPSAAVTTAGTLPATLIAFNAHTVIAGPGTGTANPTRRQLTQDDILPGFTITSFTGGSTVEIGATVANPGFAASYSSLPASASISNTDSINSPFALTTPFTTATITGSFVHTSQTSTTFTLTAIASSTQTATQAINWLPRMFGGVGTAGATGATASSTNAALAGATGTLSGTASGAGLSSNPVGATFGPYTPSGQKIYLLLTGGSHTFTSGGFGFPMNSPTSVSFTNQNGSVVTMFLYESTNVLSATFSVLVAS